MIRSACLLIALGFACRPALAAAEREEQSDATTVAIETFDGREIAGHVDARTDDEALWLRLDEAQIVMTVAIPWINVAAARAGDEAMSPEELQVAAASLASRGPTTLIEEAVVPPTYAVIFVPSSAFGTSSTRARPASRSANAIPK